MSSTISEIREAPDRSCLEIQTSEVFEPLLTESRYKAIFGGRGSGKSHERAEALIERCLLEPGTRAVCVREIQKSLEQSVKRLLEDKITRFGVGSYFRILETHIETPGDGIIIFQGMQNHTAESIKSLEGYDVAWVEEAQTLSDKSLTMLRPTLRKETSELWFTWNPRLKTDPVDVFFRGPNGSPPDTILVEANYKDNAWFPNVLRREMEWDKRTSLEKYAHIWLGKYLTNSEARVFKNWRVEEFDTPTVVTFYYGGDWGFSVDPTVGVRCFFNHELRTMYVDSEVYSVACEIDDTPVLFDGLGCEAVMHGRPCDASCKEYGHGTARRWTMTADSARPETISYMNHHGYPKIQGARKGAGSVEEGIKFLQNYHIVVHPRCIHAIDELTLYSYKTDEMTGQIMPVLEDRKNHVIDSLRYAVEDLRKPRPERGGLLR